MSVKFASQICYENIKKTQDGAYLADFGIDIEFYQTFLQYIFRNDLPIVDFQEEMQIINVGTTTIFRR